jgi:uncharacterized protein YecE (DUF72 family)
VTSAAGLIRIGCAGWNVPAQHAALFASSGTHLERYARRFAAVEINTSFYRPHRPATYARWAAAAPEAFRFAVKVPREITHRRRLADFAEPLERFLAEASALGPKLGPLLVQLPPSLRFDADRAGAFFAALRERHAGQIACEPRHPSWFAPAPERLLARFKVARVAADPAPAAGAGVPGGWDGLVYVRMHGSPEMYVSAYSAAALDALAALVGETAARQVPIWCIFDNTAQSAATIDALALIERVQAS